MTPPSRDVARHYHRTEGWALVADTEDIDIYTLSVDGRYLVRVLDCDGTRVAHRYVMQAHHVAETVALHLRREMES